MGRNFISLSAKDWLEYKGGKLLWNPPLAAAETELKFLLKSRIQRPYKTHLMVVPRVMNFLWKNQMGNEVDLLFTIPIGMPF